MSKLISPNELQQLAADLKALRCNEKNPIDITLAEYLQDSKTLSMESFYSELGINPATDTISNLLQMPDEGYRWLIPEFYREPFRLGLRKAPIYPNLIASEETVKNLTIKMPAINMSDAGAKKVGIAETIQVGEVSFDEKEVKIFKMGRGISIPDEVIQFVPINLLSIFLEDFGTKLGMQMDTLALSTLINGDQADGSDSTAVIGVKTANSLVFRDLLKPYVRMARLGKNITEMVGGEEMAMDVLDMLLSTKTFGEQRMKVDIKTPLPTTSNMYVHGKVPATQLLLVDPAKALIKLNARPLLVENDREISNQTNRVYLSITTGFATLLRDSRIILDSSLEFASNGFPTWMDPTSQEVINIES